jgi:hypothetical protein
MASDNNPARSAPRFNAGKQAAGHTSSQTKPIQGPNQGPNQAPVKGPDLGSATPDESARSVIDRRVWPEGPVKVEGLEVRPEFMGLDRRRGVGRRLSDFTRSAEEGEMTKEQFMFLMAIDAFKKANGKQYPSWTDVLEVVRLLGYRKTMPAELTLHNAEDWREEADAKANVRPQRWAERPSKQRRDEAA